MTELTFMFRAQAAKARQERRERLSQIPYDYATLLEEGPRAYIKSVSLLPHPKEEIIRAFLFCIANAKSRVEVDLLSKGLMTLAHFQDIGKRKTIDMPDPQSFDTESDKDFNVFRKKVNDFLSKKTMYDSRMMSDIDFFMIWIDKAKVANEYLWPAHKRMWERIKAGYGFHFGTSPSRRIPPECIDFPD